MSVARAEKTIMKLNVVGLTVEVSSFVRGFVFAGTRIMPSAKDEKGVIPSILKKSLRELGLIRTRRNTIMPSSAERISNLKMRSKK